MDFTQIYTSNMGRLLSIINRGGSIGEVLSQVQTNNNLFHNDNDIINNTLYEESPIKNVISEKGKLQLKKIKYTPESCSNTTCPIFHMDFEENDEITVLPCNHGFTTEAIEKWISDEKAECPVCRFKLDSIEKRVNNNSSNNMSNQNINNFFSTPENSFSEESIFNENYVPLHNRFTTQNVIYSHPFGPRIERVATIISEDDDQDDLMRAINTVYYNNANNRINSILNSRAFRIWQNNPVDISSNPDVPSLD